MTRNGLGAASGLVVLAMGAAGALVASTVPDGVRLPVHWGFDGTADGFADKWTALMMPAAIAAGVSVLFYSLPSLEPRKQGLERSQSLYAWSWATALMLFAAIQLVVVSAALGWDLNAGRIVIGALGVMFVLIGNALGKSRPMYMVGIRTPWTLASEEVWIKTHRLGGKLMVVAGLTMLAAALLALPPAVMGGASAAAMASALIVPVVYSYLLWRQEGRAATGE